MIQEDAIIAGHKQIAPRFFKLALQSKYISSNAVPGQFIEIKVSEDTTPLLRKPFSIHHIDPAKQIIEILYEVIGTGTEILSGKKIGEQLNIIGPLGNGFNLDLKDKKIVVLAGGGMGVAPLLALGQAIKGRFEKVFVLIGARHSGAVLCEQDFKDLGAEVIVSTDDESYGRKGFVSDSLLDLLSVQLSTIDFPLSTIFACGPHPMLKAIAEIAAQNNIDCQVSMEAFMACGIGACKGCAIETKSEYKMVCKDGPIFNSKELKWN